MHAFAFAALCCLCLPTAYTPHSSCPPPPPRHKVQTFKADGKLGKDKFKGSLEAAFSHNNLEFKDVKIDTASKVGGKMNLKSVADGLDLTFAAEDGLVTANSASAKFGLAYKNADFGTFNAAVNVIEGPVVTADTLINYQGFLVGGEVELNTGLRSGSALDWSKYNVGVGYDGADFRVGVTSCVGSHGVA